MRRVVAGVLFAVGAFWLLPALYTISALAGVDGAADSAIGGFLVIFTALIYVFPSLILIGLGTLIWPKRQADNP